MGTDPRYLAFKILLGCHKKTVTLDQSLDLAKDRLSNLSQKDRNLCNAIVFGVLRHQGYLDHILGRFSKKPFEKMDKKVAYILRIGLFQLIYLDRVPDFAAIHTSIEMAKKLVSKGAAGFINAVLRRASTSHETVDLPDPDKDPALHFSVAYNIPAWLAGKWLKAWGEDRTRKLCRSINEIPPITLRVNTLKTNQKDLADKLKSEGIKTESTDRICNGLNISNPGRMISDIKGFDQGFFQVQDEAAQMVSQIVNPLPGEFILDACAGLGGKACHLAQIMGDQGRVMAADIDARKLASLDSEARRLGITTIETRELNIIKTSIKDFPGYFDRVLVDAPCTGLGVLRRNPDTRWKRTQADILRMSGQQKKILNASANLVKPGGLLVYAVCSCETEENEKVIEGFLNKRKDFYPDPENTVKDYQQMTGQFPHYFKTYPDNHYMDGFFAARLRRR